MHTYISVFACFFLSDLSLFIRVDEHKFQSLLRSFILCHAKSGQNSLNLHSWHPPLLFCLVFLLPLHNSEVKVKRAGSWLLILIPSTLHFLFYNILRNFEVCNRFTKNAHHIKKIMHKRKNILYTYMTATASSANKQRQIHLAFLPPLLLFSTFLPILFCAVFHLAITTASAMHAPCNLLCLCCYLSCSLPFVPKIECSGYQKTELFSARLLPSIQQPTFFVPSVLIVNVVVFLFSAHTHISHVLISSSNLALLLPHPLFPACHLFLPQSIDWFGVREFGTTLVIYKWTTTTIRRYRQQINRPVITKP